MIRKERGELKAVSEQEFNEASLVQTNTAWDGRGTRVTLYKRKTLFKYRNQCVRSVFLFAYRLPH